MLELTIGRDPACDIVLADPSVSRRHARLDQEDTHQFRIVDLGSSNGVFVRHRTRWIKVDDANVERDTGVLLGQVEMTVDELLDLRVEKDVRERPRVPTAVKRAKTVVQAGGPKGSAGPEGSEDAPPRQPVPKTIDSQPPHPALQAIAEKHLAGGPVVETIESRLSDFHLMVAGAIAISIALIGIVFAGLHMAGIVSTFLYHLVLVIVTLLYAGILFIFMLFMTEFFEYRDLNVFLYGLIGLTLAMNIFNFVFVTGSNNAAWDAFLQNWKVLLPYALFSMVFGIVMIVFAIRLLQVADRFAGLLKPYSFCMIAAGSLYATVLFSLLGVPDLFVGAANVMLGMVFLEWASMMRRESLA